MREWNSIHSSCWACAWSWGSLSPWAPRLWGVGNLCPSESHFLGALVPTGTSWALILEDLYTLHLALSTQAGPRSSEMKGCSTEGQVVGLVQSPVGHWVGGCGGGVVRPPSQEALFPHEGTQTRRERSGEEGKMGG